MNEKYFLTKKKKKIGKITLFQIKATKDFSNVKKGDEGGYISSEKNLSQYGDAWVYGDARVSDDAEVSGDARVSDNARVHDDAKVYGNAQVFGDAWVYNNAQVYGNAQVFGDAWVYNNAQVYGNAWVHGNANVYGNADVYDNARVYDEADVYGNAKVSGDATVYDNARVYDAQVSGNEQIAVLKQEITVEKTKMRTEKEIKEQLDLVKKQMYNATDMLNAGAIVVQWQTLKWVLGEEK